MRAHDNLAIFTFRLLIYMRGIPPELHCFLHPRPPSRERDDKSLAMCVVATIGTREGEEEEEEGERGESKGGVIMGNSLRCCIACVLPCGALDMVRVLHADGRVDVYSGGVTAGEVMKVYPKHVLGLPTCQNLVQKPTILHPEAELQKGKIYFLVPTYSLQKRPNNKVNDANRSPFPTELSTCPVDRTQRHHLPLPGEAVEANYPTPKRPQRLPEPPVSHSPRIQRRRSRRVESCKVSMWRPALQSISEADLV